MKSTSASLRNKILTSYWKCYYHHGADFQSVMAQGCIEILDLMDQIDLSFKDAVLQVYNIYDDFDDEIEREQLLACIAWYYFNEKEINTLVYV